MKSFLRTAFEVIGTFIIGVGVLGGLFYGIATLEQFGQGKPSYIQIHNCRFVDKIWEGKEDITHGRHYYNVYFEFKSIWKCDNGPYYTYSKEEITPAEIVKGIESGRFRRVPKSY